MANDRVYLRCKTCRAQLLLFKYWPGLDGLAGPFLQASGDDEEARIGAAETFVVEHLLNCHPKAFHGDLRGDPGFDVYAESEDAPSMKIFKVGSSDCSITLEHWDANGSPVE